MQSVITSKFQTTIPKAVRENLKLSVQDALEWKIERGKVIVYPAQKKFLQHKNTVRPILPSLEIPVGPLKNKR
jgi:AbrB family looped-hinge helix DNA binding protein